MPVLGADRRASRAANSAVAAVRPLANAVIVNLSRRTDTNAVYTFLTTFTGHIFTGVYYFADVVDTFFAAGALAVRRTFDALPVLGADRRASRTDNAAVAAIGLLTLSV